MNKPELSSEGRPKRGFARASVGIVLFKPETSDVCHLLATIAPSASAVLLYLNSPIETQVIDGLKDAAGVTPLHLLGTSTNEGLGSAYNAFIQRSIELGSEFLVIFDQDSTPSNTIVEELATSWQQLVGKGEKPALVGPLPIMRMGEPYKIALKPGYRSHNFLEAVDFAISSGSLICLKAAVEIGPFREDFFIDGLDIEWGFRAWSQGWSVWVNTSCLMMHHLGRGALLLPFGLQITDQPPQRIYTYLRNQVAMMRLSHIPLHKKILLLPLLVTKGTIYIVHEGFSGAVISAVFFGFFHGFANKLGRPDRTYARANLK